jgi:hypothetical protein
VRERQLAELARRLDREVAEEASPTAADARGRVRDITARRREVEENLLMFRELDRYLDSRERAYRESQRRLDRLRVDHDSVALGKLTSSIRRLLQSWRFPVASDVRFNPETDDLLIDGKDRSANGKGVRAVTHAAFTFGLMRYCFETEMPHPGFSIVDTPLTTYKGERDDEADPRLTRDLHAAFLYSLARGEAMGQALVIENVDPPDDLPALVHTFTGPAGSGRQGFYPPVDRGNI